MRDLCGNRIVLLPPDEFPPEGEEEPTVLDCGYGKGAWIDSLLEEHEDCEVTGVDIYLGDGTDDEEDPEDDDDSDGDGVEEFVKKRWNLNAAFRHDRSASRLLPESFDLINSRFLAEGIHRSRWPSYIRDLKLLLKPGGWVQMVELELLFQSENGRLATNSSEPLIRWSEVYRDTMLRNNKDPRIGRQMGNLLNTAGFERVFTRSLRLNIGAWSGNSIGVDIRDNIRKTLRAVLLWPCAGHFSGQQPYMDPNEYRSMIRAAEEQLMNDNIKPYCSVWIACGRRPLTRSRR
ncbi:hypothetical protein BAUCODRAFT_36800 [Baudoinia panamericana UAMH 10762]|uniref:Methyltransferase domain-containing protein n=1 Tax=Baudoinia panamericana (strain UAMH 10762) TaxID=717646 RepID=M2M9N0_BAUPA|nr:uncharacterized protein BAUCODRAFT_36800 [Baudoinia panamericana UAMH 10762]EMC93131.1 hypothetical protein BAUCODRAFT_36800 [Baudoinia panamericana UAMH 10762]